MSITPELLRKLALKLEKAQAEVALELKEALGTNVLPDMRGHYVNIPTAPIVKVSHATESQKLNIERNMRRWVESNMSDEERTRQARAKKATKGVTHRITEEINKPRYKHLREAGFQAGMKFKLLDEPTRMTRLGNVVVRHIRSGKTAIISTKLLETIPDGQF